MLAVLIFRVDLLVLPRVRSKVEPSELETQKLKTLPQELVFAARGARILRSCPEDPKSESMAAAPKAIEDRTTMSVFENSILTTIEEKFRERRYRSWPYYTAPSYIFLEAKETCGDHIGTTCSFSIHRDKESVTYPRCINKNTREARSTWMRVSSSSASFRWWKQSTRKVHQAREDLRSRQIR